MNLKGFSSRYLPLLEDFLSRKVEGEDTISRAMRYALFPGGKRFRPLLVMASTYAVGGKPENSIEVAGAIELIHNFTLIHDDLPSMDNDDFRRGKPTLHRIFGEGMAVLAGDALLNLAYQTIAESGLSSEKKEKILQIITRSLGKEGVMGGQAMDISMGKEERDLEKLRKIYLLKTSSLIQASVTCGAIVGEAGEREMKSLEEYSRNLGLAFQIMDDVREAKEGKKPPYPDYPALLGIEKAEEEGRELVRKAIQAISSLQERNIPLVELANLVID